MKKTLLLLVSAALLLVGCAKEKFAESIDGGMTNVTFTASLDGGVATKALADEDGDGTNVNRCIMEIYFQDQLYKRMVEPVTPASGATKAFATFSNVPVVAGKEYEILFWADHVDVVNTEAGLATDKYYTTKTTTGNKGLKAVTVNKTNFIDALKSKKNDELDAFFFADNYTVPQNQAQPFPVTLKRPFAQLNVITIDVAAGKTVTSEDLLPEKVSVSYKAADVIDVATGAISSSEEDGSYTTYTYEADVYGNWSTVATKHELTLSMDYLLASTEQGAVDVTFITKNGGEPVMTHSLTNLPYKRNYRTNVKGELLTTVGSWKAEIDPEWAQPDIVKVVEVADIKSANEIINQYASTTKQLEVKFTAEPNDSGVPAGEDAGIRAIVTTPIQQDASLSIEVLTPTKELYIGDYKSEYIVSGEDVIKTDANHAVVNVNVPESSSIVKLVINAPSKSVYINGKEVANVGTITNLDAITSQNTLIIEKDQTIGTLTIRQGGLEIHGTVGTLEITEEDHDNNPVKVRTSENLSQTVFDEIYKEGEHDYIDRPAFSERQNANSTWDIVPSVCMINQSGYGTIDAAVAAVQNGQTIKMLRDVEMTSCVEIKKPEVAFTLDLAGCTIARTNTGCALDVYSKLTICDSQGEGKISAIGIAIYANGGADVTLESGTVENTGESDVVNVVWYGPDTTPAKFTMNGGTVNRTAGTKYAAVNIQGEAHGAEFIMNGGVINSVACGVTYHGTSAEGVKSIARLNGGQINAKGEFGVGGNGSKAGIEVHIGAVTIVNTNNIGIYHPENGVMNIEGATITGTAAIVVKGGTVNINGGTYKATGAYSEPASPEGSGCAPTGDALYIEDNYGEESGVKHDIIVNIADGTFISQNASAIAGRFGKEGKTPAIVNIEGGRFASASGKPVIFKNDSFAGSIIAKGGIYSDAPDASFVAEGYAVLDNTDAATKAEYPKTVKVKPVVKIGNVEYADIADAFAAVPANTPTTVTLLENIGSKNGNEITWKEYAREFAYTVNSGQNITFDLNGKKIYAKTTVNGYTGFFLVKNGGSLTIKDSAGGGELNYLDGKDNKGGLAISSEGNLTMLSGTVENHTHCVNAAIQGAIDVHANEWGTPYAHHVTFNMKGGVLKSQTDNTLRIFDSSQTGTGGVVIDFEINGGEIYGADAVFIMPAWIAGPTHVSNDTHMNNINVSVTGGHFDTTNGIRVFGAVNAPNDKDYKAIDISVTGGEFIVRDSTKYREGHIAYQNNYVSSAEAVPNLVSFTKVTWTADAPTYIN